MARKFIPELNFLRGLACLAVLTVHVSATYFYENGGVWDLSMAVLNQIGRFGTPVFAVLSGFLLFYPFFRKPFSLLRFARSKLVKIVTPFLIWGVFYYALSKWMVPGPLDRSPARLVQLFGLGHAFYHLYFMSVVIQFYVVFPLLQRWLTDSFRWRIALIAAGAVNVGFLLLRTSHVDGWAEIILLEKAFLPSWIFYFIFGGFLAFHWERIAVHLRHRAGWYLALGVLLTAGAVLEYQLQGMYTSKRLSNLVNIPLLSLSAFALFSLLKERDWAVRPIMQIGSLGFGIYLVHPLVLYFIREALPDAWWQPAAFPAIWLSVLGGTMLLVWGILRLPFSQYLLTVPRVPRNRGSTSRPTNRPASTAAFK